MEKISDWDDVAEWWDRETGEQGVWHQRHDIDPVVRRVLGKVKGKKVLELGCGNGYFARALARAGAAVTAIDGSSRFVSLAKQNEQRKPRGVRYLRRDAAKLVGIRSRTFDNVVANMVFMDIPHFQLAIREASRVLTQGGRLVFSLVHPIYSDWQHAVVTYNGKKYYARILKKYLSETSDDRMYWKIGHTTVHYHRPLQSYFHALRNAGLLIKDLHEVRTSRKLKRAPFAEKRIMDKLTRYYLSREDKKLKQAIRKEIPLFLVVEAVKVR